MLITVPGGELFFEVRGEGPCVIFLHGLLGTHRQVLPLVDPLAERYLVVTPDLRGRGASICRDEAFHTWDRYAEDVLSVMDALGAPSAAVGGSSAGSGVALAAAMKHPARVSGLILVAGVYAGAGVGWIGQQASSITGLMRTGQLIRQEGLDQALETALAADPSLDPETVQTQWRRHDPLSVSAALTGIGLSQPFEDVPDLRGIRVPALIFSGDDHLHPAEVSNIYREHLRGAVDSGLSTKSPLSEMSRAMMRFLDDIDPAASTI